MSDYQNLDSQMENESVFKLCMMDKHRKVRIEVKLVDETGDEVPVGDTLRQIVEFTQDKLKSETPFRPHLVLIFLLANT